MPKNALDNPLVLPILGLLVEQPRHAYAVFSEVRSRYGYLEVRNATVYTLLDRLTAEGWVADRAGPSATRSRDRRRRGRAGRACAQSSARI